MQEKHVVVVGPSGGGKSTNCRERHSKHDGVSVWLNHEKPPADGIEGVRVDSFEGMVAAVRACSSVAEVRNLRIDYRPTVDAKTAAEKCKMFGVMVSEHFDNQVSTQITIDEAHHLMPDSDGAGNPKENPVAWLLAQGRGHNIKAVIASQDPMQLHYSPLKNAKYIVWVGEGRTWHRGFFSYFGLRNVSLPSQEHRYVVLKPTDPPKVVYRGETDPTYG